MNIRLGHLILFTGITIFCSSPLFASSFECGLTPASGAVSFVAIGRPSALKIHGKGKGASGTAIVKDQGVTGSFSFELSTLETGMSLRDRHMKEKYLEVEKFPKAELTISKMTLPAPFLPSAHFEKVSFEGKLKLHGTEAPVQGSAQITRIADQCKGVVTFSTQIPKFGIATPSFSGIKVADDVEVSVEFQSTLKESNP